MKHEITKEKFLEIALPGQTLPPNVKVERCNCGGSFCFGWTLNHHPVTIKQRSSFSGAAGCSYPVGVIKK
jgi:hypothetical protein